MKITPQNKEGVNRPTKYRKGRNGWTDPGRRLETD